jgi:hypothetical protein
MFGASTTTGVAKTFCPPVGHHSSHLSSDADPAQGESIDSGEGGALASARKAVSRALQSSGFLDIAAPFDVSLAAHLQYHPAETEAGDLSPGVLNELMSLLKTSIAANPEQGLEMQTRVRPERAVRLLA